MVAGGYQHKDGLPLDEPNRYESSKYLARVKKWEELKKKRSLISDEMLEVFYRRHQSAQPDSLDDCFYDWLAVGRYTGFRASEWAQTRKYTYALINDDAERGFRAMIDGDWLFYDQSGRLLDKTPANTHLVYRVDIWWRVQKNANNGEIICFWRDDIDSRWCPVRAAWRICQRARQLNIPSHALLGQYIDHDMNRRAFLHETAVEAVMRSAAHVTTCCTDKAKISKMFGMHSIRVTACNELARLHVSDSFIQCRLCWKGTAFLEYLRNRNIHVAHRPNLSLNIKHSPEDTELTANLLPKAHQPLISAY